MRLLVHTVGILVRPDIYSALPSIGERFVYYWKNASPNHPKANKAHLITIIGCKKYSSDKGLVFYLYPADRSDPMNRALEKI